MKRLIILIFLTLVLISCDKNTQTENIVKTLTHQNGLVLVINNNIEDIKTTDHGYKINLAPMNTRNVNEIIIKKLDTPSFDLNEFQEKEINKLKYLYKVESINVGSGGAEYTLTIWKPAKTGGIILEQYIQTDNDPDYKEAWEIIKNTN
jgi:hypothetical protein